MHAWTVCLLSYHLSAISTLSFSSTVLCDTPISYTLLDCANFWTYLIILGVIPGKGE